MYPRQSAQVPTFAALHTTDKTSEPNTLHRAKTPEKEHLCANEISASPMCFNAALKGCTTKLTGSALNDPNAYRKHLVLYSLSRSARAQGAPRSIPG